MRPLSRGPRLTMLVATIALAQALFGFSLLIPRGGDLTGKAFPTPFDWHLTIGTLVLGPGELLILIVAPLCALGRHGLPSPQPARAGQPGDRGEPGGGPPRRRSDRAGVVRDLGDRRPARRRRSHPHRGHPPAHAVGRARPGAAAPGARRGDARWAEQHLGIVRRRHRDRDLRGARAVELPRRRRARAGPGRRDPAQHAAQAGPRPQPSDARGRRLDVDQRGPPAHAGRVAPAPRAGRPSRRAGRRDRARRRSPRSPSSRRCR